MKLSLRKSIDEIKTFSRTFVERPRFAMVSAIVLTMAYLVRRGSPRRLTTALVSASGSSAYSQNGTLLTSGYLSP